MRPQLSAYLDVLRFLAAILVFGSHLTFPIFTGGVVAYQGKLAGEAVVMFFVLSGYVIAYVSSNRELTARHFVINRLARIYSVALPAIALTILVDMLAMRYGWPRNVPVYQYHSFVKYLLLAITFCGQAGPLQESTFGGHTFWSLDYEVWYYAIFAAAFFLRGAPRVIVTGTLMVLSGPRIAIDFPMWLLGVAVYKLHEKFVLSEKIATSIFAISVGLLLAFRLSGFDTFIDSSLNSALFGFPIRFLGNSQEFASEYVAACLVAANIFAARYMSLRLLMRRKVRVVAAYTASFTFTLYLMQRPLMDLFAMGPPYNPHSPFDIAGLICATLALVWLLGIATEHRKLWWRKILGALIPQRSSVH